MPSNNSAVVLPVSFDLSTAEREIASFVRSIPNVNIPIKIDSRPLGTLNGQVQDFAKSVDAASARTLAFGATVSVIGTIAEGFRALVKNTLEVNQALTQINSVVGLSETKLNQFGKSLFDIAKNTGQSFATVADTANQFARQTDNAAEVLKRTNAALVLTRITGLETSDSLKVLTASLATYKDELGDVNVVLNKIIAADIGFAVSARDIAEGISRSASSAKDAKISYDQLVAIITATQSVSQRGGAVIGNSLKSIFTKLDRPAVLDQLEQLGINVRNIQGATLPAIQILTQLAQTYDHLSDAQKANVTQLIGGVYQANILRSALGDLGNQYSTYNRALNASINAGDTAINRNNLLNKSYASLANSAQASFTQISSKIGDLTVAPLIKNVLGGFNNATDAIGSTNDGKKVAEGFLKGIGDYISGPGLILAGTLGIKFFSQFASYSIKAAEGFASFGVAGEKQKAVLQGVNGLLQQQPELYSKILSVGNNRVKQEQLVLELIEQQNRARETQNSVASAIGSSLYERGARFSGGAFNLRAGGFVPNFLQDQERNAAASHGYSAGNVIPFQTKGQDSGLTPSQFINQAGIGRASGFVPNFANSVVNTNEYQLSKAGSNAVGIIPPNDAARIDPIKAASQGYSLNKLGGGFVPNFASNFLGRNNIDTFKGLTQDSSVFNSGNSFSGLDDLINYPSLAALVFDKIISRSGKKLHFDKNDFVEQFGGSDKGSLGELVGNTDRSGIDLFNRRVTDFNSVAKKYAPFRAENDNFLDDSGLASVSPISRLKGLGLDKGFAQQTFSQKELLTQAREIAKLAKSDETYDLAGEKLTSFKINVQRYLEKKTSSGRDTTSASNLISGFKSAGLNVEGFSKQFLSSGGKYNVRATGFIPNFADNDVPYEPYSDYLENNYGTEAVEGGLAALLGISLAGLGGHLLHAGLKGFKFGKKSKELPVLPSTSRGFRSTALPEFSREDILSPNNFKGRFYNGAPTLDIDAQSKIVGQKSLGYQPNRNFNGISNKENNFDFSQIEEEEKYATPLDPAQERRNTRARQRRAIKKNLPYLFGASKTRHTLKSDLLGTAYSYGLDSDTLSKFNKADIANLINLKVLKDSEGEALDGLYQRGFSGSNTLGGVNDNFALLRKFGLKGKGFIPNFNEIPYPKKNSSFLSEPLTQKDLDIIQVISNERKFNNPKLKNEILSLVQKNQLLKQYKRKLNFSEGFIPNFALGDYIGNGTQSEVLDAGEDSQGGRVFKRSLVSTGEFSQHKTKRGLQYLGALIRSNPYLQASGLKVLEPLANKSIDSETKEYFGNNKGFYQQRLDEPFFRDSIGHSEVQNVGNLIDVALSERAKKRGGFKPFVLGDIHRENVKFNKFTNEPTVFDLIPFPTFDLQDRISSRSTRGTGFVPNFNPLHEAISREAGFGKQPVIGSAPDLGIPIGVYNTDQKSKYGNLSNTIRADHLSKGQNPSTLSLTGSGKEKYTPNFASAFDENSNLRKNPNAITALLSILGLGTAASLPHGPLFGDALGALPGIAATTYVGGRYAAEGGYGLYKDALKVKNNIGQFATSTVPQAFQGARAGLNNFSSNVSNGISNFFSGFGGGNGNGGPTSPGFSSGSGFNSYPGSATDILKERNQLLEQQNNLKQSFNQFKDNIDSLTATLGKGQNNLAQINNKADDSIGALQNPRIRAKVASPENVRLADISKQLASGSIIDPEQIAKINAEAQKQAEALSKVGTQLDQEQKLRIKLLSGIQSQTTAITKNTDIENQLTDEKTKLASAQGNLNDVGHHINLIEGSETFNQVKGIQANPIDFDSQIRKAQGRGSSRGGFLKDIFGGSTYDKLKKQFTDSGKNGDLFEETLGQERLGQINTIDERVSQRRFQGAFLGSIAAPILGGVIGSNFAEGSAGEKISNGVGSAAGTALQFAAFGPQAAAVGVVVGSFQALDSILKSIGPNFEELSKASTDYADKQKEISSAAGDFIEAQQNYTDALNHGASTAQLSRLQKNSANLLQKVTDPTLANQLSGTSDVQSQLKILDTFSEQSGKDQADKKFSADLAGFDDKFNNRGVLGNLNRAGQILKQSSIATALVPSLKSVADETITKPQRDNITELAKEFLSGNRRDDPEAKKEIESVFDPKEISLFEKELERLAPEIAALSKAAERSTETLSILADFKNTFSQAGNQAINAQLLTRAGNLNNAINANDLASGLAGNRRDFTNQSQLIDFDAQGQRNSITNQQSSENLQVLGGAAKSILGSISKDDSEGLGKDRLKQTSNVLNQIQSGQLFGSQALEALKGIQAGVQNRSVQDEIQATISEVTNKLGEIQVNTDSANQKLANSVQIQKDLLSIQNAQKAFGGIETLLDPNKFNALFRPILNGLSSNIQTSIANNKINTQARRDSFGSDIEGQNNFLINQNKINSDNALSRRGARDSFSTLFSDAVQKDPSLLDKTFGDNTKGEGAGRINQINSNVSDIINSLKLTSSIAPGFTSNLNKDVQSSLLRGGGIGFAVDRLQGESQLGAFQQNKDAQAEIQNAIKVLRGYDQAIDGGNKSLSAPSKFIHDKSALPKGYVFDQDSGILTKINTQPGSKKISDSLDYQNSFKGQKNISLPNNYVYDPLSGITSDKNSQPGSKKISDDPKYKNSFGKPFLHGQEDTSFHSTFSTFSPLLTANNNIGNTQAIQSSIANGNNPISQNIKDVQSAATALTSINSTGELNIQARSVVLAGADVKSFQSNSLLSNAGLSNIQFQAAEANVIPQQKQKDIKDFYINRIDVDSTARDNTTDPKRKQELTDDIKVQTDALAAFNKSIADTQKQLTDSIANLQTTLKDFADQAKDNPVVVQNESNINSVIKILNDGSQKELTPDQQEQVRALFQKLFDQQVKAGAKNPPTPTPATVPSK